MALTISTLITDTKLKEGVSPLEIASITVVVNFNDGKGKTYFGGQVTLTAEDDGISFQTTTEALQDLAIVKAKRLISEAKLFVPDDPEPVQSEATSEAPQSDAHIEAPASEATSDTSASEAISEATVADTPTPADE